MISLWHTRSHALAAAEIKGHLASLANVEAQREKRAALHRLCRDFLIQMDTKIDELVESSADSPKASYAAARMLQQRFEREGFTPSVFDDWADIDRAKATLKKLDKILSDAGSSVGEAFQKVVMACLNIPDKILLLDELLALIERRENLPNLEMELAKAGESIRATPLPTAGVGIRVVGGCLTAAAIFVLIYDIMPIVVPAFFGVLGILLWPAAKDPRGYSKDSEFRKAHEHLKTLQGEFAKARERVAASTGRISELASKFDGETSHSKLIELRGQLQEHFDALFTSDGETGANRGH